MLLTEENLHKEDEQAAKQTIADQAPYVKPEELKDGIYTEKDLDYESVVRYIKGYEWKVDYYNLIGDVNTASTTLSVNTSKGTQSYNRIKDMTIYLESPLEVGNIEALETTAIINTGVIPFQEDVIVAEVFGGRTCMFTVMEPVTLSYQKHHIYKIKLKFKHFKAGNEELFKNLEDKVVQKLVEDKDYVEGFGSPLIVEEEFVLRKSLKEKQDEIIKFYVHMFKDRERSILNLNALPYGKFGCDIICPMSCDVLLNNAIQKVFGTSVGNGYDDIRWIDYNVRETVFETVWDAIINRDLSILKNCSKDLGFVAIHGARSFPASRHPAFLGVKYIVDERPDTDFIHYPYEEVFEREDTEDVDFPLSRITMNGKYIFSESFYNMEVGNMTKFELLLYNVIARKNYTIKDLLPFIENYKRWSRYEQYYIIPILLIMIRIISYEKTLER